MAEKTEKQLKTANNLLKRLVKQRKPYLSLARKCFKNQGNIKRKREAGSILQKREVSKTGGLESSQFILRTVLVIPFH